MFCYAGEIPSTSYYAFSASSIASATLHVPANAIEAYRATAPWSEFGTIIPITQDEEDAIHGVSETGKSTGKVLYDLNGRKVAIGKIKDGIYIENGRKIVY